MSSKEWKTVTLGEISKDVSYGFTASAQWEPVGPKFLRITDIVGGLNWDTVPYCEIDESGYKKYSLKIGDIVIARTGATTGTAEIIKEDRQAVFASYLIRFRINDSVANAFFVGHVLKSNNWKEFIESSISGSAQPGANATVLSGYEFSLPPLPIQRRIADMLSALDEKIELNRQTNATLEALAQSIFREWFVEFNFPNEIDPKGLLGNQVSSQAMESGENESRQAGQTFRVSNLPQGWRVIPLDKIADFLNGLALQKFPAENENDYLPVIKIRELKNGVTNSTDKASKNIPSKYVVHDGDLIFSWSGTLEVKFWVGGKGALNQHLFKVTSEEYPLWFCYFWILHHIDKFRGIAADKTTTMGHIQRHHLSEALCVVPDDLSQMDKVLRPLIEQMINLEQQSATLASMREALLPKLMSGEVAVHE